MPSWLKHVPPAARFCGDCALAALCWTLWLALGALLVAQVVIAVSHELAVPGFVLRGLEGRFAASHIEARLGRVLFDPTGRLLLENLQLTPTGLEEPVVTARAVFVELEPWPLLVGRVEAREIRATGVALSVPAMFAPSGKTERIVTDLECTVAPRDGQIRIDQCCATVAGVAVDVHGSVQLPPAAAAPHGAGAIPLLERLSRQYPDLSRRAVRMTTALAAFEQPQVQVALEPSPTRGAIARVTIAARRAHWPVAGGLTLDALRSSTSLPLFGDTPTMAAVQVQFGQADSADGITARNGLVHLRGVLTPAKFTYAPRELEITARQVARGGLALDDLLAELIPGPLPRLEGRVVAACAGSPLALEGQADLADKSAAVHLAGGFAPALLDSIGTLLHRDLHPFLAPARPVEFDLQAQFDAGWKFRQVAGRVAARQFTAHGVPLDRVGGEIEFDGRRLVARHAFAELGDDVARGTFEQDVATREYRFLLEGRLRPLDIAEWFHEWWENIFRNFAFPVVPPGANVDVRGRWHAPEESEVFVAIDARDADVRSVRFDRLRTRLFIRPNFIDGLEVTGTHGDSAVEGTFVRHIDVAAKEWRDMSFAVTSSFPLEAAERMLGPAIAEELEPFTFAQPPHVSVTGRLDGPAAPGPAHQTLDIVARSTGPFTLYQFPGRDLSFTAALKDHDLTLQQVSAVMAGGQLAGTAHLSGAPPDRRLAFDARLAGADLGTAIDTLSNYKALRRGQPAIPAAKFFSGKASAKLDASLAAEGRFSDLFSYQGKGTARLEGPELGEVRLLGLLSALLNFTALRFTAAHGDFTIDGPKLTFPALSVTGRNSAIEAHGSYSLDRDALDFNARVFPFQESKSLLSVVGAVLTPLSTALEVKLTGPLAQPNWAFVIGPTNLLRSLTEPAPGPEKSKPAEPPRPLPHD